MKNCPYDREAVTLLACSAVDSAESARIQRHLQECRECREYFRQISEICAAQTNAARALPEAEASARLHGRVASAIRAGSRRWWDDWREFGGARWLEVAGVAAVLLLLFGGLALFNRTAPTAPEPFAGPPPPPTPSTAVPEVASPNLIAYRLALNRSPEEFDRLLAHAAARPTFNPTRSLRPGSSWADAGL